MLPIRQPQFPLKVPNTLGVKAQFKQSPNWGGNWGGRRGDTSFCFMTITGYPEPSTDFLEMRLGQLIFSKSFQNAPDARSIFLDQAGLFEHVGNLAVTDDRNIVPRHQLLRGRFQSLFLWILAIKTFISLGSGNWMCVSILVLMDTRHSLPDTFFHLLTSERIAFFMAPGRQSELHG